MRLPQAVLVRLLLVTQIALVPLGHATPTDPTWVPGFWDDGDYDDVALLVSEASGVASACWLSALGRVQVVRTGIQDIGTGEPHTPPQQSERPRAPPSLNLPA